MKEAIATGETVELAREAACRQLGVETYDAEFEILEMPTKKTFGLFGGSPAKVRVFLQTSPADAAAEYLKTILSAMGLPEVQISVTEEENGALLSMTGDDIGFIIGHRGETLDALQYLAGLVANHIDNSYYRVTLDIGNYREKRKETLEILGKNMAAKAVKTGRNAALEPMNPYERRIIHTAVQTVEGAKSWSEGEDLSRHVVIGPEAGERPLPRRPQNGYKNRGPRKPYGDKPYGSKPPYGGKPPFPQNQNHAPAPRPAAQQSPSVQQSPAPAVRETEAQAKAPLYGRIDFKK